MPNSPNAARLQFAIGRMIFDPLRVAAETVALVQHRGVAVGEPRAFVEMAAGEARRAGRDAARCGGTADPADECAADPSAPDRRGRNSCPRYPARAIPAWSAAAVARSCLSGVHILLLFVPPGASCYRPSTDKAGDNAVNKHNWRIALWLTDTASSAPRCRPTRSRSAPISATRQFRINGSMRNAASQAEFEKHAKMPIIPLVITPEGTGIQDSTPDHRRDRKSFIRRRRSIPTTPSRTSFPR